MWNLCFAPCSILFFVVKKLWRFGTASKKVAKPDSSHTKREKIRHETTSHRSLVAWENCHLSPANTDFFGQILRWRAYEFYRWWTYVNAVISQCVQKWCDDYLILDCVCVCFFRRFLKLRSFRFQRRFVTNDSRFVWEWQVVHSILSGSGSTLKAETSSPNLFQSFTAYDLNRKVPVAWKTGGKTMAKWMDALVTSVLSSVLFSFEDQYLNLKLLILISWCFCLKSCVYSKTV